MQNRIRWRVPRFPRDIAALLLTACFAIFSLGNSAQADWRDIVGYTQLTQELTALGIPTPTGDGIIATHVEADESGSANLGNYRPNPNDGEFLAPPITKDFVYQTTSLVGLSSHATVVGRYLYGNNTSVAAGVSTVNVWEANDWIGHSLNHTVNPHPPFLAPAVETGDVANFSWIGTTGNSDQDVLILQRLDYQINRDDFVAVVGMNNGNSTTLPNLLGQGYNTIGVGLSSGIHSHGTTTINGAGRRKPDIVAPASYTSYATPMVGSAAAMLLEPAKAMSIEAAHSQTIKAILMAGATKTTGTGGLAGTWSHTQSQPLDATYGAGQLNINRSYHILMAGEQQAGSSQVATSTGWDFGASTVSSIGTSAASGKLYFFDVPVNTTLDELSAVLTWNASVDRSGPIYTTSLANLDLSLWSASGFSLGTMIDQSISTVDNVELLSLHNLAAGRYALDVTSATGAVNYALAWYGVSEPVTLLTFTDSYPTTTIVFDEDILSSVLFNNTLKNFTVIGTAGIAGAGTVTKQGSGTVTMGTVNTYSGVTTVEGGSLVLQGVAKAQAPVLTGGGANLKSGKIILDYTGESSPAETVKNLLTTSYHAGNPTHFDTGKFQSTTADDAHGLGWIDNPVTQQITVAYTLYGDANVDGIVNLSDLTILGQNWNGTGKIWAECDVNYDGIVDLSDLTLLGLNWNVSTSGFGPAGPTAVNVSAVPTPEPGTIVMLASAAIGFLVLAWSRRN